MNTQSIDKIVIITTDGGKWIFDKNIASIIITERKIEEVKEKPCEEIIDNTSRKRRKLC